MSRFISDDYNTRFNVDRIAFVRPWGDRSRNINVHFSGGEDDYTMARFRTEESASAFLLDVAYGVRESV